MVVAATNRLRAASLNTNAMPGFLSVRCRTLGNLEKFLGYVEIVRSMYVSVQNAQALLVDTVIHASAVRPLKRRKLVT